MKIFLKKYKVWIWSAIYLFLIAGFFYWGIFRLVENIQMNLEKMQQKALDNEVKQKKIAKIPEVEKRLTQMDENEKKLTGLLRKDQEVDFIKKLETLAAETKNGIELTINESALPEEKKSTESKAKGKPTIKLLESEQLSFRANLWGDYPSLIKFINKLENFEYFVNIISISSSLEKDNRIRTSENPFAEGIPLENIPAQDAAALSLKTQLNFIVYTRK